jgi:hypothetical protein
VSELTSDETGEPTDRALRDLIDAERHREAVEGRRRRQWLRHQADESVSVIEVVRTLTGHGLRATLVRDTGAPVTAPVCEVGADYVGTQADTSHLRLLPIRTVTTVRAHPGAEPADQPRSLPDTTLVERLRELARLRPTVSLTLATAHITGRLRRCSHEVLVIDEPSGGETYVALAAVIDVELGAGA